MNTFLLTVGLAITIVVLALILIRGRFILAHRDKLAQNSENIDSTPRRCPVQDHQRLLELKRRRESMERHHDSFKRELAAEQQIDESFPATREALRFQKLELEPIETASAHRREEINLFKPTSLQVGERWDAVAR